MKNQPCKPNLRLTLGANPYYPTNKRPFSNVAKRNETHLVGITADARHTTDAKIEWSQLVTTIFAFCKASLFEERHNERTETTIDVKTDVVSRGKRTERDDIVLIAIGKVDSGAYELTGTDTSHESAGK